MSKKRLIFGEKGEELAAQQLKKLGYRILIRNYRTKFGEIDIIAEKKATIIFVEVKIRRTASYGQPMEAVTSKKQQHLSKAALTYLTNNCQHDKPARFDVVSILLPSGGQPQIEVIENAFDLCYGV